MVVNRIKSVLSGKDLAIPALGTISAVKNTAKAAVSAESNNFIY